MRIALLSAGVIAFLVLAQPALAQPAPPVQPAPAQPALAQPARCDVRILRSPEPVRLVIEARLRREAQCETSLAMRVVPTTEGLYLLGLTPSGHAYEMVVPDAETAAELIAAWAQRRDPAAAVPSLAPPVGAAPILVGPPGDHAAAGAPGAAGHAPGTPAEHAPGAPSSHAADGAWLGVMAIVSDGGAGIRGEIDLWAKRGWSAGVALTYSEMEMESEDGGTLFLFGDIRAVATVSHTLGRGPLRLRGHVGVGGVRTQMTGFISGLGPVSYEGTHAVAEASALAQVRFGEGRAWAVTGGPMLTLYSQTYVLDNDFGMQTATRTLDVSFTAGLRRRF